ncbi:MAG: transposase family protein [Candidatus Micrarchaeota archaeon]
MAGGQTGQQTKGIKEEVHPPQVDGFKMKGKLVKGKLKDLATVLRSVSFLEIAPEKDVLNVLYVESRDINKNPHLFSIIKISEDEVDVLYTIPPEIGPNKRKIDVIRYLLNIVTLIETSYQIDQKTLYQLLESAIKDLTSSVSIDYTKLFTAYDSLKKQVDDYRKRVDRLAEQNQALTSQNYELKTHNDELTLRVKQLEGLSDSALKAKLQEWIVEHSGAMNMNEFTKLYNVSDARIEEILNRLVSEGYIEIVQ